MARAAAAREPVIAPAQFNAALAQLALDLEHMSLCDLSREPCVSSTMPAASTPKTLDLAHLITALWFHQQEPLTRFVSLDGEQNVAAVEPGLPV